MQKAHDASKNDWWRNLPDITTPITQDELNRLETTVDVIDNRVVGFDLSKANQSDLLQSIKGITYNTETGVWVFTWWNGSTLTVDQNIEKIPVSFSMSPQGVITMTTSDGTQYTCDIATLIKTYSFLDSDTIDFTDTVDSDGNHTITADIKNGSITGDKLQPNYLADCVLAKQGAETAETNAETAELNSLSHQYNAEAWAKGTKNNVPVTPTDAQYHDNAYYWAQQARAIVGDKVDSFNGRTGTVVAEDGDYESGMIVPVSAQVGQIPVVRNVGTGQEVKLRYVNEDYQSGILPHVIVISEENSTVRLVKGGTTIYASETSREHFEADVPEFGTWTIHSVLNGEDAEVNLVVDAVKIYTVDDSHLHADITVTYPDNTTCSCSKPGETTLYATGSPYTFTVHALGAWTITVSGDGRSYSKIVNITEAGQTESVTMPDINGSAITPTDDVITLLHCAGIFGSGIETVSDLLADDETLLKVINSTNAIDYLVRSTTFAGGSVPIMTSNTTPSGLCSVNNGTATTNPPYLAFDNNNSTFFCTDSSSSGYVDLTYKFTEAKKVRTLKLKTYADNIYNNMTIKIGYSDGGAFTYSTESTTVSSYSAELSIADYGEHLYWCAHIDNTTASSNNFAIISLQFYEADAVFTEDETAISYIGANDYASDTLLADSDWRTALINSEYSEGTVFNVTVPEMTGYTTPSGTVASSGDASNLYSWYAFQSNYGSGSRLWVGSNSGTSVTNKYIQYTFPTAKKVYGAYFNPQDYVLSSLSYKIQGIEGGTTKELLNTSITAKTPQKITFQANIGSYSTYRVHINSWVLTQSTGLPRVIRVQFYGREAGGIQTWLLAGGITDKDYTTLAEVLADSTTLSALMASESAVDYLVTITDWASEICADSTAMSYIGFNNYAANTLLSDADWCTAICNSTYFESVLNVKVPAMTSATTPSGEVFVTTESDANHAAWKAFDNNDLTGWCPSTNNSNNAVGYDFGDTVAIRKVVITAILNVGGSSPASITYDFHIQGSNTSKSSGFEDIATKSIYYAKNSKKTETFSFANSGNYRYYRLMCPTAMTTSSYSTNVYTLQFYAREDV